MGIRKTRVFLILCACLPVALAQPTRAGADSKPKYMLASLGLPGWLKLDAQLRGRAEFPANMGFQNGESESYYLSRIRLDVTVKPASWFRLFVQGQDSHAAGYTGTAPASVQDPFDVRQAYVEFGGAERRLTLRAGRQVLAYGGGRLISPGEWGNTIKSFDSAVLTLDLKSSGKLDLLGGSVVLPQAGRIDRHKPGEHLYGAEWRLERVAPDVNLESFLFAKTQRKVFSENGAPGDAATIVAGFRLTGKLPHRFDYVAMINRQSGNYSTDRIAAFGGNYAVGWRLNKSWRKPRISAELYHGSADGRSGDGKRNSLDPLYPSYHNYLGAADRLGWRNSRNLRAGLDTTLVRGLKGYFDLRELWLASAQDAMYDAGGAKTVLNARATSRHVGRELDCYMVYEVTKDFTLEGGFGYLRPGAYLQQSGRHAAYLYPYLMWTKRL
jgi:hypothetical protein